jgi:hypothetical protein
MKILVEEEYGWRYWVWTPESDDYNAVREEFETVTSKENYFCLISPRVDFGGQWDEVEHEEWMRVYQSGDFTATAHLHDESDSVITERKETHTQ